MTEQVTAEQKLPMRTVKIGRESVEVPDWDRIQAAEIATLKELGERIGYGRCIQILQQAWSQKAQTDPVWPRPAKVADMEAGIICVWCLTDSRTGKKVKKP